MTSPRTSQCATAPPADEEVLRLLQLAAQLLLEYNVRSSVIVSQIHRLAISLGIAVQTSVAYRAVTLYLTNGRSIHVQTPEYRINVAVNAALWPLIDQRCAGRLTPTETIVRMQSLQHTAPCNPRWLLAVIFGLAASALACLLNADLPAAAVSGLASALGLLLRQQLIKRHWPLFAPPFAAAAIGGTLAGLAIRLGWTQTPGLCLLVPALMLVPGPHLIQGLYDIFENHIQTGACRLLLSAGILISAALGVIFGGWVLIGLRNVSPTTSSTTPLTLGLDMILAGVAACGFGAFYNAPWRVLWISIACGMIGHGTRFLCLAEGLGLPASTLLACITIGLLAGIPVLRRGLPFSSIAFAAAVPMMPGTLLYRAIAGAVQLALAEIADPAQATTILVLLLQASLVVSAMVAGLLLGALLATGLVYCWLYQFTADG